MMIEPLNWRIPPTRPYPCFICGKKEATLKLKLHNGNTTLNLCACLECAKIPELELCNMFLNPHK